MGMGDNAAGLRHTGLGAGGDDDGQVEDLAELGVREDGALHLYRRLVAAEQVEPLLVVDDEQHRVGLVDPLVLERRRCRSEPNSSQLASRRRLPGYEEGDE